MEGFVVGVVVVDVVVVEGEVGEVVLLLDACWRNFLDIGILRLGRRWLRVRRRGRRLAAARRMRGCKRFKPIL